MRDACADFETELAEFNGESNHARLLVHFPPKVTPARVVNSLKGASRDGYGRSSPTCAATRTATGRSVESAR
jgi:putative transposase